MSRDVIDERITIKPPQIPHTVLYLLLPIEGLGALVFLAYVAFHWESFVASSTAMFAWMTWFAGFSLYTALGWFVVKTIRAGFEALHAGVDAVVALGQGAASIYQQISETNNVKAQRKLLHTETNYVVYLVNNEIVVESIAQERYNYSVKGLPGEAQGLLPSGEERNDPPMYPNLPESVPYEGITVPQGHALLGVGEQGPVTCDFANLMTMWICGGSSTGKSNTVGIKIEEAIKNGRNLKILCIDYHARKADSLYNKIRVYENRFLMPVAMDEESALNVLNLFLQEFKNRRTVGSGQTDILLVVDEVPAVLDSDDDELPKLLKRIVRICGRESRGFGMFGWFISQNAVGLAWLRSAVLTVIAHKMNMMNEALLACNEHKDIARDMENWPRGRVIVYGLSLTGFRVLQMPLMSHQPGSKIVDSEAVVVSEEETDFASDSTHNFDVETNGEASSIILFPQTEKLPDPRSEKNPGGVEPAIKETIRRMKKDGMKDRKISKFVGLCGRKYHLYQGVLTELGLGQAEPETEEEGA